MNYFIYILRCTDNSLYTGITTDLNRRFCEHTSGDEKGAKYTKSHRVKEIAAAWQTDGRANAAKAEFFIKKLTKAQKEALIKNPALISAEYKHGCLDFCITNVDIDNYKA